MTGVLIGGSLEIDIWEKLCEDEGMGCKPGVPAYVRMLGEAGLILSHRCRKVGPCPVPGSQAPGIPNHEAVN